MGKLDTVVGDLRAEFSNTVKLLETSFDKLKAENTGPKDELKLVKTEFENSTTKMAELETKLQEVQGDSIANEQYTRKKCAYIWIERRMRVRTV